MKPAIVALYPWSGHTHAVGADIPRRPGCPLIEITGTRLRRGLLACVRSGYEALTGQLPDVVPIGRNLRDFLARHRHGIGTVAAFCEREIGSALAAAELDAFIGELRGSA